MNRGQFSWLIDTMIRFCCGSASDGGGGREVVTARVAAVSK